jgi:hypothetical protein
LVFCARAMHARVCAHGQGFRRAGSDVHAPLHAQFYARVSLRAYTHARVSARLYVYVYVSVGVLRALPPLAISTNR